MTLRQRLALTLVLAAVPLVAALAWAREELLRRASEDSLRDAVVARMEAGGREQCEADPAGFRGRSALRRDGRPGARAPFRSRRRPGWPVIVQTFDAGLRPTGGEGAELPGDVARALAGGEEAKAFVRDGALHVAVRLPWDEGPCAAILAARPLRRAETPAPGLLASAVVLCAGFVAAVWVAAGPVVRRIRSLAEDVRRSAASRYAAPVTVTGRDELAALAHAFNEAGADVRAQLEAVERREQMLRSFLANTSHDLMLPLTVLQGHLSRLREHAGAGEGAAAVAAAAEEAQYVASLVQNLSAAAKLEAGEPLLQKVPFDLSALLERVVERHRVVAGARGVEIGHAVPEAPVWAFGDLTLVEQAVSNLVHNAVRHNRRGGHVAVVLEEEEGDRFLLRVEDDGPGVPEAALPRLGEPRFRTAEARQRHPEGLGLGLSIARDVAERHGYELTFASASPTGLVARLRGPRALPAA